MKKTILFITFLNASAPNKEVEIPSSALREMRAAPSEKVEEPGHDTESNLDKLMGLDLNREVAIPNLRVRANGIGSGSLMIKSLRKSLSRIIQERGELEPFERISPFLEEVLFTQGKPGDSIEKRQLELLANLLSEECNPVSTRHLERLGVEVLLFRINHACSESAEMLQKYSEADSHTHAAVVLSYPQDIEIFKERLMSFPKIGRLISNLNLKNARLSRKGEEFLKARADLYKKDITQQTGRDEFLRSIPACIKLALTAEERKATVKNAVKYKTDVEETEALLPAASAAQRAERTPIQENLFGREAFEWYFEVKYKINFTNLCNGPDMHDYNEKMRKAREETCVAS